MAQLLKCEGKKWAKKDAPTIVFKVEIRKPLKKGSPLTEVEQEIVLAKSLAWTWQEIHQAIEEVQATIMSGVLWK